MASHKLSTGKENKITITNDNGHLSQNDIERMVQNVSAIEKSTGKENKKRERCHEDMSDHNLTLRGSLTGHSNWVTSIATTSEDPNLVLSSSRDKSVLVWTLTHACSSDDLYSYACRALCGHSHFVSGVVISSDGQFALSGSWDGTLRLWEINSGKTTHRFYSKLGLKMQATIRNYLISNIIVGHNTMFPSRIQ